MTRLLSALGAGLLMVSCGGATRTPLPSGAPPEYEPPRPYDAGATNVDELGSESSSDPADEFGEDPVPPPAMPTTAPAPTPSRELLPPVDPAKATDAGP